VTDEDAKRLARALVDEVMSRLGSTPVAAQATTEAKYMKVTDYAKRSGFCRSTVQELVRAGMPAIKVGKRGHKIDVRAADEWLRHGGAARVELHS